MSSDYQKLTCSTNYELNDNGKGSSAAALALPVFLAGIAVEDAKWIEADLLIDGAVRSVTVHALLVLGGWSGMALTVLLCSVAIALTALLHRFLAMRGAEAASA